MAWQLVLEPFYRLGNAWLSLVTVDSLECSRRDDDEVNSALSSCLISNREVCGDVSDESAVNELLQTAVSAQPNDESISADRTLNVWCLPKRKCLWWKTAVEIIRDGTGPFKRDWLALSLRVSKKNAKPGFQLRGGSQ